MDPPPDYNVESSRSDLSDILEEEEEDLYSESVADVTPKNYNPGPAGRVSKNTEIRCTQYNEGAFSFDLLDVSCSLQFIFIFFPFCYSNDLLCFLFVYISLTFSNANFSYLCFCMWPFIKLLHP